MFPRNNTLFLDQTSFSHFRGKLIVPAEAEIISAEPALVMLTKKGGYLLSASPTDAKKNYTVDTLENLPFLSPKPDKNITSKDISIITQFNESQEILAKPSDASNNIYEVATFRRVGRKIPGMPESGNEIEILQKGWMFASDIKKGKESFKPFSSDIFQGNNELGTQPNPQGVNQTWIADCFLLSTAIAVLHSQHGMDFFTEMMHQCDDGTTIVRLYHPKTLQPHYIRVTNSYHSIDNKSTVAHEQPWIHLLEKAYAVFAFNSKEKLDFPSFLSIYGSGGDSSVAFKILTGKESQRISMQETSLCNPLDSLSILTVIKIAEEKGEEREKLIVEHSQLCSLFKSRDILLQWGRFLLHLKSINHPEYFNLLIEDSFYANIKNINESLKKLSAITLDEKTIDPEEKSIALPDSVKEILKNNTLPYTAESGRIFYPTPENTNKGEYTRYHYEIFDRLKELSRQNIIMTASTHGAFEEKVPGLVAKHEYAILGVYERHFQGKTLLMVRLRNPWGYMGCRYNETGQLEEEREYPVFDLNIADFTNYFLSFSTCEAPHIAPLNLEGFLLRPTYSNLMTLHEKIRIQFNVAFNDMDKKNESAILQKNLIEELTKISFLELEAYLKNSEKFKYLQADFLELERTCRRVTEDKAIHFENAKQLILTFLERLNGIILKLPISENNKALYNHLVYQSEQYTHVLFQQIEEHVKEKHPDLYTRYSLDRPVFNESKAAFQLVNGFNIDAFITDQQATISQQNSSFQLNIEKYKVMIKANNTLKNNRPMPIKLHAFNQILRTNEKLLAKDPWYYIILKTLATLTASLITAGVGSLFAYRFFFGNNSTKSKIFLNNIKPDLNQISRLSF